MSKLVLLFLLSLLLSTFSLSSQTDIDDDEDLTFLDDDDNNEDNSHHHNDADFDYNFDNEQEYDEEDFDESQIENDIQEDHDEGLDFNDPDVVILKDANFTEFVEENKYVMVEFYAPWCGHCQALAPEYGAAAAELKSENASVILAKVDGTVEEDVVRDFDVDGFPAVFWFVDGERVANYNGARTKDAIMTWIKKKIGPGVSNITTLDEAERVLSSENKVVLGYLDSLVGPESEELAAASKLEDDVNFYQTGNPDVAKLFHIDPEAKRPAMILIKREAEKINIFDNEFTKRAIVEFISANKLPLVIKFTRESASSIFESSIKKQVLLFASKDLDKVIPTFEEAAKLFKGKLIFVHIDVDDEESGRPVADYFGITGDAPQVLGFTGTEDSRKFVFDNELTLQNIKAFGEDFLEDKIKPFYKSDPVPDNNDGDVKIVVGKNFDDTVLDESKDVLLEIYAPWCGHCQALEPTYNKLAKHLHDVESLVIAKMDGTTNEHPRAKAEGFPTILFFPAGNKTSEPIPVDADRTVKALYKFLRKNASIPFKLQKTTSTPNSEKDEL